MNNASEIDREVGRLVREQRLALGRSQREIAEVIGCSHQQVQKWETGVNRISAGALCLIAQLFGVPITTLVPTLPSPTGKGQFNTGL